MTRTVLVLAVLAAACVTPEAPESGGEGAETRRDAVDTVLDDWHLAASEADGDRYLGYFAPGARFLGTDAKERWSLDEFAEYTRGYMDDQGTGWTYVAEERVVDFSEDGNLAWFDEELENNKYGEMRGSGVMLHTGEGWRILQYNMTFTVPNEVAKTVVDLIRGQSPE